MFGRLQRAALLSSFAIVLAFGSMPSSAQAPKADRPAGPAEKSAEKPAFDPSRRVPDFFGQIGLTPEQRESVYTIRGKHQKRIAELEKQIAQIRSEMLSECETQLTSTQKDLLTALRRAAAERKKAARAGSTPSPTAEKKGN